jgi:hypothetical protein
VADANAPTPQLTFTHTPPVALEVLGARIEVPVTRAIVSRWRLATPIAGGAWQVALDVPVAAGSYLVAWRTPDPEPPAYEAFTPLTYPTPTSP